MTPINAITVWIWLMRLMFKMLSKIGGSDKIKS